MSTSKYSDGEMVILRRLLDGPATAAELLTRTVMPGMSPDDTGAYLTSCLMRLRNSGKVIPAPVCGQYALTSAVELVLRADQRRPLAQMRAVAEDLVKIMLPGAVRIEIAGSIRRQKQDCGDIEICALVTDGRLTEAFVRGAAQVIKSGPKYTQAIIDAPSTGPVTVDLFSTDDPTRWGLLFFIRTGSADFVKRALGYWKKISDGGECRDLHLYKGSDTIVATPEEDDVFRALGIKPVAPERRVPRECANG